MTFATEMVMEATPKTVVVVENSQSIRISLVKSLKQRGFQASGAATRAQMLELVRELKQDIDVAVLDVNLEDKDKDSHATTGFDIGQEMIEAQPDLPPQRIVYSGHDDQEYYQAAVRMGADDYIIKATPGGEVTVINRVSTSSLLRALSPVRAEISEKIGRIAERDLDTLTEVGHICLQVIAPEVKTCLGVPFVFLLNDRKGTHILSRKGEQSEEYAEVCAHIQNKVFEADKNKDPFVFFVEDMDTPLDDKTRDFLRNLEGGSFIPLYDEDSLRLSIGILPAEVTDPLGQEKDSREFASNLNSKLREPVVKQFKYLSRIKATIEKTKLKHTSNFCLYVSKTQINVLEESLERKEIEPDNNCFLRLKKLADDLYATGLEFSQLNDTPGRAKTVTALEQKVSVRSTVQQAWKMLEEQGLVKDLKLEQTGEDVEVVIAQRDLLVAALRMLQWLAQRADRIPPEAASRHITVAYEKQKDRVAISFTDQSRRLGERLRRKLFEPFTQSTTTTGNIVDKGEQLPGLYLPLYLAKTLITVKNNGALEDRTNELPGNIGHSFVMSFPVEEQNSPNAETG